MKWIEIVEAWAKGEDGITLEMVRTAAADATLKQSADIVRKHYPKTPGLYRERR